MTDYKEKDAVEDTTSSSKEVSHAWHTARDDSGVREGKDVDLLKSPPDWADKTTDNGTPLFPDREDSS